MPETLSPQNTVAVVLNYNGREHTLACLRALAAMEDKPGRVIVVDNASTDGSPEALEAWLPGCGLNAALLRLPENNGYAAGNNAGLRLALDDPECRAAWVLNNDTEPRPGALAALCHWLNLNPGAGMAGSTLVYAHDPELVQCAGGYAVNPLLATVRPLLGHATLHAVAACDPHNTAAKMDYVSGASLLARRSLLQHIGLFAEEYFLYYEDTEFGLRAKRAGHALAWARDSVVAHHEGGTTGAATGSGERAFIRPELVDYLSLRNRAYLARRLFFPALPVTVAGYAGVIINRIRRGQADRVPLVLLALIHGLAGKMGKPRAADPGLVVLHLTARADFGGGPEHLLHLLRHAPENARSLVACPRDYPYYDRYCALVGAENVFELPHRKFSAAKLWQLRRFCRERGVTILLSHGKGAGLYSRPLGLLASLPCVHAFHGVHTAQYGRVAKKLYQAYERCFSAFTQAGIAVSKGERERILEEGLMPAEKIRLIPNGVAVPGELADPPQGPPWKVVSLSRFDAQKNSAFAVDVLLELQRLGRLADFRFLILGDGLERQRVLALARERGLEEFLHCPGATPEPHAHFAGALCCFSSSRWEGLPLALLEAMGHGLPVVASDVVGNRDAVHHGETGLLYPGDDAAAAAAALCGMTAAETRKSLGQKARDHVALHHDVRQTALRTHEALLQAARSFFRY